jgi:hypothetical protein
MASVNRSEDHGRARLKANEDSSDDQCDSSNRDVEMHTNIFILVLIAIIAALVQVAM